MIITSLKMKSTTVKSSLKNKSWSHIFVAADHGGWEHVPSLLRFLESRGKVTVLTPVYQAGDDYPKIAAQLARRVQRTVTSFGIALCRTGVGMAIVSNKFSGIRCAQVWSSDIARSARQEEDANIMSLAADAHTWPQIRRMVDAFLSTPFNPKKRYRRRLKEIAAYEK